MFFVPRAGAERMRLDRPKALGEGDLLKRRDLLSPKNEDQVVQEYPPDPGKLVAAQPGQAGSRYFRAKGWPQRPDRQPRGAES